MEVSILITVKNDRTNMIRLLNSLSNEVGKNAEVVIVDAFSTDGTYEILKNYEDKLILKVDRVRGNRAIGRNRCIELATGENFIFLDSDTEVTPGWFAEFKKHFEKPIVAGRIIQKGNVKWNDLGRVPMLFQGKDVTFPSNNLKYSKAVIDEIGKFDVRMHTAEDIDLNIRAIMKGYDIFYAEDVVIYHYPRENLRSLLKQAYSDGIGRKYINKKYKLKSKFNVNNLKAHPIIEFLRLSAGIVGYLLGDFHD
jgi:glycosyltransferase involved in cell wall biosynthesis